MYRKIVNPKTNRNINLNSNLGKKILNKYLQSAGWLNPNSLRKELSNKGYYRFGFEFETCMHGTDMPGKNPQEDGWNCSGKDNIESPISPANWDINNNHELIPVEDSSIYCINCTQKSKEFIQDARADYLWNGIKSDGYTNIGDYSEYSSEKGYSNINTILNNILRTFYSEDDCLMANPCLDLPSKDKRHFYDDKGKKHLTGSCGFHTHISDPFIKGTSVEGKIMLLEISALWRGVKTIKNTPIFGLKSNTFPFMETEQNDMTVQDTFISSGLCREILPWTARKLNEISITNYTNALVDVLDGEPNDMWIDGIRGETLKEMETRRSKGKDDITRYWTLNSGQDKTKGWKDKDDGVHVEFRGHEDLFRVFNNEGMKTKDSFKKYLKNYLRHLIQIMNAGKNRMNLLIYINNKFNTLKTKKEIVNIYISFIKSGVVNLEILRQKLYAVPDIYKALGGDFILKPFDSAEITTLKGIWKNTRTDKIRFEEYENEVIEVLNTVGMSEEWIERKYKFFHQGLTYSDDNTLYGTYGLQDTKDIVSLKDMYRMFALPNPNTIGPPFINNLKRANLGEKTINNINMVLIRELLELVTEVLELSEEKRIIWVNDVWDCLKEARITTVYRLIYMFHLEDPNDIGYPFNEDNKKYKGKRCGGKLNTETVTIIKEILNGYGISSDVARTTDNIEWY
jgi:hypothetical protein